MSEIKITRAKAAKAYQNADTKTRKVLVDLLGEENVSASITDMLKTYQDACEIEGCDPVEITIKGGGLTENDKDAVKAFAEMTLVTRLMRGGKDPNWADPNEYKYQAWQKYTAGSGFSESYCGNELTDTNVGSRLSVFSSKDALYLGKQFASHLDRIFKP